MRQFWMVISIAALGFLPACAAYQTETTGPTVSYNYSDEDSYAEVAEMADDYCEDNYGTDAQLLDQDTDSAGNQATFSCE